MDLKNAHKDNHINNPGLSVDMDTPMGFPVPSIDEKALRMMQKMGYKPGSGLGKDEQGIKISIEVNTNLGKRGLGHKPDNSSEESWDFSQEDVTIHEKVQWITNQNDQVFLEENMEKWVKEGPPNNDVQGNSTFCDEEILQNVFKAKGIFNELDITELDQARARANPFETIRSMFFMNRAALKMANLDAACDFMFTSTRNNDNYHEEDGPVYFADVCAGPGGFTEYILWRKLWLYKGFGLTLKGERDFKVSASTCASSASFQALYGVDEQGDICNPENIKDFVDRVTNETEGRGVDFMVSDGGFCVDGQEDLQEVLSKNIYLCQCLLALSVLRPHGHFLTKTFDVFTPFSVGLLYLVYLCFEKVGIIKPNASRPANSERYFVCNNFKMNPRTNIIRDYLWKIAIRLWEIKTLPDRDIVEIVPLEVLKEDQAFFQYIRGSNTSIGKRQIVALKKLGTFCRNPALIEARQQELRTQCLEYWKIPDRKRTRLGSYRVENILDETNLDIGVLTKQLGYVLCTKILLSTIRDVDDWYYTFLYSTANVNRVNFYAGVGYSNTYRLQNVRWVKVKHLELAKGTLLYGEFIKERYLLENNEISHRCSVHVIDALFLGSMDLRKYTYRERLCLINIYCKSVNRESQTKYSLRVRPKTMKRLSSLPDDLSLLEEGGQFCATLPKIGYKSTNEKYEVNSVLVMKTHGAQSVESINMLAVPIKNQSNNIAGISFEELSKSVKNMLL